MTTTLTVRGPEDLLAATPVLLGFHPEESLVMLTFGADHTFHARVDLPPPGDEGALDEAVAAVLGPSLRHGVDRVMFVVYSGDAALAARLAAALVPAFVADGIGVIGVVRADQGRWCSVPLRAGVSEPEMRPYDDHHHAFSVQAVYDGRVTLASREQVRATVAPDTDRRARWSGLIAALPDPGPTDVRWARDRLADWAATGAEPDDEGAARVLRAVVRIDVRDAALYAVTRDTARDHLRTWAALLRGAPDAAVPDTAAVTAFCAWQAGDGALAWCALDRCFDVDPEHPLGRCVGECLARALPPTAWDDVADSEP